MRISVVVKPNKTREEVVEQVDGSYVIYTKAPARENKANEDVVHQIAQHFKAPSLAVRIHTGASSKRKIIEITGL